MEINGSAVVVTGGASGLGEACVRNLVELGAKVAILDVAKEQGEKLSSQLGDAAIFCLTDVTDEKSVADAVYKTGKSFGGIHVTINCAGVGTPAKVLGKDGPMPIEHFNQVIQINLVGTMNVVRLATGKMLENMPNKDGERGVIINTASVAAWEGQVGQAAYSASKAGVVGMTLPIARELADHGIRVVTIAPGIFDTPLLGVISEKVRESLARMMLFPKRFGRPNEFAGLACHIIENPMLNGETIRIDAAMRVAGK